MRTGNSLLGRLGVALAAAVIGSWVTVGAAEPKETAAVVSAVSAATDATSQPNSPVQSDAIQWTVQVAPAHPKPGDTIELVFTADIPSGWILYSSDFSADIGPRPARFSFEPTTGVELIEGVQAIKSLRRKDKTWNTAYAYFERRAEFRQKAKLIAPTEKIAGRIDGQTCFEESGLCKLFRERFTASLD